MFKLTKSYLTDKRYSWNVFWRWISEPSLRRVRKIGYIHLQKHHYLLSLISYQFKVLSEQSEVTFGEFEHKNLIFLVAENPVLNDNLNPYSSWRMIFAASSWEFFSAMDTKLRLGKLIKLWNMKLLKNNLILIYEILVFEPLLPL